MKTVEVDDDELRLLLAAVHSYLDDFGHEEADLLRRAKQLLAKLRPPRRPSPSDRTGMWPSADVGGPALAWRRRPKEFIWPRGDGASGGNVGPLVQKAGLALYRDAFG